MEYDSESSCDDRLRDLETAEQRTELRRTQQDNQVPRSSTSTKQHFLKVESKPLNPSLNTGSKSLSAQVMEYYHKYAQSSNLDQYFSLPTSNVPTESVKHYYSIYELNYNSGNNRQACIGEEYNLRTYVPRERRRWVRPPLIGQSSSTETSSRYVQSLTNSQSLSPDPKDVQTDMMSDAKNEIHEVIPDTTDRKVTSPTSSVASHKPLEWDSGADVGYFTTLLHNKHDNKKLSTIERMALARGCSAALRLDPEGTTESGVATTTTAQNNPKSVKVPKASSTLLKENMSESDSEMEITPIVKNHLPGIITGSDIKSIERSSPENSNLRNPKEQDIKKKNEHTETPKSSFVFRAPLKKYSTEKGKVTNGQQTQRENFCMVISSLKKSTSMNTIAGSNSKVTLKRSQSDLNLHAKDKGKVILPLIYNSTSSIATVVNKPATCDKVIQTSFNIFNKESVGVQVSDVEEDKPPLPKRGTSLQKSLHSILKNSKSTYKIQSSRKQSNDQEKNISCTRHEKRNERMCNDTSSKIHHTNSDMSPNESPCTSQPDDTENVAGRANSFEYFPGHVYENVPNGNSSHVSSVDTGESNSTLPNTSSSINEKLWGDSDSLVRDLERSVNILRSLVDANKCDKQVKKRLIHHVVKRLVTAKYTDDKIEHNLEDNVPWNPDDARKKVYRAEILHALTKKHSTTDSSDDWRFERKNTSTRKFMRDEQEMIGQRTLGSSNSDKFDKNTDRTETDGRKARMGLRTDDCPESSNTATEPNKSESSECFFPQRIHKNNKMKNAFYLKEKCKASQRETSSSTNSTPPDHNRMLLDAVVNSRRTPTPASSNRTNNDPDWKMLTTLSERQFEFKRRQNVNSGDLKLVDYAEMEKRNQLVWITNEISHLCNLKKLLEEPRKLERPKSSPRRSKSAIFKTKPMHGMTHMRGGSDHTDSICRDTSDLQGNSIGQQWSSHCNLATCCHIDTTCKNLIQRTKKRNSSSQTATESTSAHSKTGGEIISATKVQNTIKLINAGVQTHQFEACTTAASIQTNEITQYVRCPIHKSVTQSKDKCKCTDQIKNCQKDHFQAVLNGCLHCSQKQYHEQITKSVYQNGMSNFHSSKEDNSLIASEFTPPSHGTHTSSVSSSEPMHSHFCIDKSKRQYKQKETKNQINASKSKCLCNCKAVFVSSYNDCNCGVNNTAKKSAYSNKVSNVCQLYSQQSSPSTCEQNQDVVFCICKSAYMCKKKEENMEEVPAETANGCACRSGAVDEVQMNFLTMNSDPSCNRDKTRAANQSKIVNLCSCTNDCSCETKMENEFFIPNTSYESCSNGKTEQNGRYCSERSTKLEQRRMYTQQPCYSVNNAKENESYTQSKVQTRVICNCSKDCSCPNKAKETNGKNRGTKYNAESNHWNGSYNSDIDKNYKYCRMCGKMYRNIRQCNCHQTYPKSFAYEISFTKGNNQNSEVSNISILQKSPHSTEMKNEVRTSVNGESSRGDRPNNMNNQEETLQDYLLRNKPKFVNNAEIRRRYVSEIAHLRQLRKEKRMQLLAMASTSNCNKLPRSSKRTIISIQRTIPPEEMKERLRKRYRRLDEVQAKKRQQERQEEIRRNKLMARIFCKKLQQKVLRGQVDLSPSVSVISNL